MQPVLAVLLLAQICGFAFGQPGCECKYYISNLELGIVFDVSSSITPKDFIKGQHFLKEYLGKFQIGKDAVRVSLITFSRVAHAGDSFNLTTYNSYEDVAAAIDNIPHRAKGYTATGEGIKFMREQQLAPQFVRNGATRVSVVITDGGSQSKIKTTEEAKQARDEGIILFAIGVGDEIKDDELESITGDKSRVGRVDSYDKLTTITDWIAKNTCLKKEDK
ncbi:hypothetical protein BsWGS_26588 [Bradybaena similaris]